MVQASSTTGPRTIRVGLLICGNFSEEIEAVHGSYHDIYTRYWKAIQPLSCGIQLAIDSYYITDMDFPEEDRIREYDIFMVTASPSDVSAYDNIPWVAELHNFLGHVIKDHSTVRICGTCFGHQVIGRILGGTCTSAGQLEVGPTPIDLTDVGKAIFGVEKLSLQQIHWDHVPQGSLAKALASDELQMLGSSNVCDNQGIIKFYPPPSASAKGVARTARDIHILTMQGHPEYPEPLITAVVRQNVGIMEEATVAGYWERRWVKTDGLDIVARVIWKMLGVAPSDMHEN